MTSHYLWGMICVLTVRKRKKEKEIVNLKKQLRRRLKREKEIKREKRFHNINHLS